MASEILLNVATRQFGDRGFEGTSTRSIAAAAHTAMSSITYHFGGKEGLYLACADHIAAQIARKLAPVLDKVDPLAEMDRERAIAAITTVIEAVAGLMLGDESDDWAGFIVREQQNPGPAFDRLYQGIMHPMEVLLLSLLAVARPELDGRDARALAITLLGQALILRSARATMVRVLNVDEPGEAEKALLLSRIRYNVEAILRSDPPS